MKALLFRKTGSIDALEVADVPSVSELKPDFVRLKFLAGSLNHLDLWVIKGLPRVKYQFPMIAGADVCGEVIESRSNRFKLKDRVIAFPAENEAEGPLHIRGENLPGVFSEEIIVHEKFLRKAPEFLSNEEAASIPLVYVTAWQMLVEKAGLNPEKPTQKRIIVHGAGSGVSHALLNFLKSFGEKNIAVTSREPSKLKSFEEMGFSIFLVNDELEKNLKDWAGPTRIDIIFDHVGARFFEMNIRLLKDHGKFITCGATSGADAKLNLSHLYFRQLQLLGSTMGTLQHFFDATNWIEKSKIKPEVSKIFKFSDGQNAYRYLESSKQAGKVVLSI